MPLLHLSTCLSSQRLLRRLHQITLSADGGGGGSHNYEFDEVFGPMATNGQIYARVAPMVEAMLNGYASCIFAYDMLLARSRLPSALSFFYLN